MFCKGGTLKNGPTKNVKVKNTMGVTTKIKKKKNSALKIKKIMDEPNYPMLC